MRRNFALASPDAILNISDGLRQDETLFNEFKALMPDEDTAEVLWGLLVTRISSLHGTEVAAQMMSELASCKRKAESAKAVKSQTGAGYSMSATMEQLRVVKKQKKMQNKNIVDLTQVVETDLDDEQVHASAPQVEFDLELGQKVTAIEGTGSATRQYDGTVVEIDHFAEVIIICCDAPSYPHGYNMAVPFTSRKCRIKSPNSCLHGI